MKSDILKLKPDFPEEFVYTYNKTTLEIMKKRFDIEKLTKNVFVISNDEVSFFVIYDKIDKRWGSSIEGQLHFQEEKIEEISLDSMHKFVALNCLHTALTSESMKFLGDNTKEILDRLLNKI